MLKFNLNKIQDSLKKFNIDGWLLYDFRGMNEFSLNVLDIPSTSHLTRRFFYFIPKEGEPKKIVNAIELHTLAHLPGEQLVYASHISLINHLAYILKNVKKVAMEYSPMNAIPYLSKVDAGTIELIKSFNTEIISSADLITMFNALWNEEQYKENKPVADALVDIVYSSFNFIKEKIKSVKITNEYEVQQFIMDEFNKRNYFTDFPPIVGVNENSANPHYTPNKDNYKDIKLNDFVLIDLWAKLNKEEAVWADITWVGYIGDSIPEKYIKIFNIVKEARDEAFNLISKSFQKGKELRGYQVDDEARGIIRKAGYEEYFIHRTGHSITTDLHGSGPHMDDYETKDERLLLPSISFSIEPGIYFPNDFGVRSEIDVFINPNGKVEITGKEKQEEIIPILK
ncbi:MAG: M24 family metallopeptidase [Ignavibacterium sp.]